MKTSENKSGTTKRFRGEGSEQREGSEEKRSQRASEGEVKRTQQARE